MMTDYSQFMDYNKNTKLFSCELTATECLVFANKVVCDEVGQTANTLLSQPQINTVLSDD